jgi:AP-2 complex subunit mu-1
MCNGSLHFMLSAVVILDRSGEILAMRRYRSDFDLTALDNYRIGVIAAKEIQSPSTLVDGISFLHHVVNEVYYVGMTRRNANAGTIFEFLARLPDVLRSVLGQKEPLRAADVKRDSAEIVELLDEMVDCGFPQTTDPEVLRAFTQRQSSAPSTNPADSRVTVQATGAISWRGPDIRYSKNEVYVDVVEKVSVLVSAAGKTLDCSVAGSIQMKVHLSGMPECKIGFNDKMSVESGSAENVPPPPPLPSGRSGGAAIEVDDMVFHQCVKLTNFANDRAISFIPPDGEFELMRYRKTENIGIPFTISPMVHDLPGNKLEIRVNVRSTYDSKLSANPLILAIPLPDNTADVKPTVTSGRAKFVPDQNAVVWKLSGFPGTSQAEISLVVVCLAATSKASPATKLTLPISAEFTIPMFSPSGLALRYLTVVERSRYRPDKWLRYIAKSGKFEVRMV